MFVLISGYHVQWNKRFFFPFQQFNFITKIHVLILVLLLYLFRMYCFTMNCILQVRCNAVQNTELSYVLSVLVIKLSISYFSGYWGTPTFNSGFFVSMIAGVITSVIESIGDYYTCARLAGALPPPTHAVNRGNCLFLFYLSL